MCPASARSGKHDLRQKCFDYLVTYRLVSKWLNLEYLERMGRTMKDKQGVELLA